MGSLQVEKRNAERQHLVTHWKHTNDWKKVSLGPKMETTGFQSLEESVSRSNFWRFWISTERPPVPTSSRNEESKLVLIIN